MAEQQVENHLFKAKIFKALADPLRLEILAFIGKEEKCVCEIVAKMDVVQPLISRHLKILKDNGILNFRKEMNKRFYSVTDKRIFDIIDKLSPQLCDEISDAIIKRLRV